MPKRKAENILLKDEDRKQNSDNKEIFGEINLFVLQTGIGKARSNVFENQWCLHGGSAKNAYSTLRGLIMVVDDKLELDRICRILNVSAESFVHNDQKIVKSLWLSRCLTQKSLLPTTDFEVPNHFVTKTEPIRALDPALVVCAKSEPQTPLGLSEPSAEYSSKTQSHVVSTDGDSDSDYSASDGEQMSPLQQSASENMSKNLKRGNWVCSKSSANDQVSVNHNQHITEKLNGMIDIYQSSNDKWRVFSYQKAVSVLKAHNKPITSWQEAKELPGIGSKLADKIWEIAESGQLRKLDELSSSESVETLKLFTNVWGAGPATAQQWYASGLRSLEDLRTRGTLNKQQQIGLKHYHDILDRMPRSEAAEIEAEVSRACKELDKGLLVQACGSYRRGQVTCGDVDVLVTHPDGHSHVGIFQKLIDKLHETGFLTDDLTFSRDGNQQKYLGVCKLHGEGRKYRRLDIIVVPYQEYACALVYFTGSAHFNRSLRHLAKKSGLSLNEHSLNVGVVRAGGEKVHRGTPVATPNEEAIFAVFGLPYRPPEERNH